MYAAVLFIGITNATSVQPVISIERFVSYRERAAGMYSALPFAFSLVYMFLIQNFYMPQCIHPVLIIVALSNALFFGRLLWSSLTFLCSHLFMVQFSTAWVRLSGQQWSSYGFCSSCTSLCCTSPSTAWWRRRSLRIIWSRLSLPPHSTRYGISSVGSWSQERYGTNVTPMICI